MFYVQIAGPWYCMRDQSLSSHITPSVSLHTPSTLLGVVLWDLCFPRTLQNSKFLLPCSPKTHLSLCHLSFWSPHGWLASVCVSVLVCVICWTRHSCSPRSGLITSHFTPLSSSQLHIISVSSASPPHSSIGLPRAAVLLSIHTYLAS